MPKFAEDAFNILYPDEVAVIYSGRNELIGLGEEYAGTEFYMYVKALARNKEKFARLFVVSEDGLVKKQVNLRTGAEC